MMQMARCRVGGRYYDARDFIMLFLAFLVSSAVAEDVANVTDCLKLFGDAVVSCGSFMSAPAGNHDDCVKDVVSILGLTSGRSGLFEGAQLCVLFQLHRKCEEPDELVTARPSVFRPAG